MKTITWNPTVGCSGKRDADGYQARRCATCDLSARFAASIGGLRARGLDESADGLASVMNDAGRFNGVVVLRDALEAPMKRRVPTHYRWGTMGDPFGVDHDTLTKVLAVIDACPQHLFSAKSYFEGALSFSSVRPNLSVEYVPDRVTIW